MICVSMFRHTIALFDLKVFDVLRLLGFSFSFATASRAAGIGDAAVYCRASARAGVAAGSGVGESEI